MIDEKLELLEKLSKYVDLSTGRKRRADKGSSHNYTKNRRSTFQTKMSVYKRLLSRLENRAQQQISESGQSLLSKEFDINCYYVPIPETVAYKPQEYKQIYQGRLIEHTVKRVVTQRYIDLEQYRFEAYQELAIDKPDDVLQADNKDLRFFLLNRYGLLMSELNEAINKRKITYLEFFCETYYIKPNQINYWTYEKWKEEYEHVPYQRLEDIPYFSFDYFIPVGSENNHPEWAGYIAEKEAQRKVDECAETERRRAQWSTHYKDKGGDK